MRRISLIHVILVLSCAGHIAPERAAGQDDNGILRLGAKSFTGFRGEITSLHFSPAGTELLSSGWETILWDVKNEKVLEKSERVRPELSVFIGNGKRFAMAKSHESPVLVVDTAKWNDATELNPALPLIFCMAASSDGKFLLAGGSEKPVKAANGRVELKGSLLLWDVNQKKLLHKMEGHTAPVKSVAFIPGEFRAISRGGDGTTRVWNLENGKEIRRHGEPDETFEWANPIPMAVFQDGKSYTVGQFTYSIDPFELKRRIKLSDEEQKEDRNRLMRVSSVAISPNQKMIAYGDNRGRVRLWNVESGEEAERFLVSANRSMVTAIAFSPDGRFIATGLQGDTPGVAGPGDFAIRMWELSKK